MRRKQALRCPVTVRTLRTERAAILPLGEETAGFMSPSPGPAPAGLSNLRLSVGHSAEVLPEALGLCPPGTPEHTAPISAHWLQWASLHTCAACWALYARHRGAHWKTARLHQKHRQDP